jgi:two-component system copper resistance phosphate regulon response regulator CusR
MKLLYVEDSSVLGPYVAKAFRRLGHVVDLAEDGANGLWLAQEQVHDLLILDVMLPKLSGFEILERLRATGDERPVLFLTAKDTLDDKLKGFGVGADDFLVKPFEIDELIIRAEARYRRYKQGASSELIVGGLRYDMGAKKFDVGGEALQLKRREFLLLELLIVHHGKILSRTEIEQAIYDENAEIMSNSVNSAVSIVRKKLSELGCADLIHTRRGLGYILEEVL